MLWPMASEDIRPDTPCDELEWTLPAEQDKHNHISHFWWRSLVIGPNPEAPSSDTPRFLTHTNGEIISVRCFGQIHTISN